MAFPTCLTTILSGLGRLGGRRRFGPYCSSRRSASDCVKPEVASLCSSWTTFGDGAMCGGKDKSEEGEEGEEVFAEVVGGSEAALSFSLLA